MGADPGFAACDSAVANARTVRGTIFNRSATADAMKAAQALCSEAEQHACRQLYQWITSAPLPQAARPGGASGDPPVLALIEDARFSAAFGRTYDELDNAERRRYLSVFSSCRDPDGRPFAALPPSDRSAAMRALGVDRRAELVSSRQVGNDLDELTQELPDIPVTQEGYDRVVMIDTQGLLLRPGVPVSSWDRYSSAAQEAERRIFVPIERFRADDEILKARSVDDMLALVASRERLSSNEPPSTDPEVLNNRRALASKLSAKIGELNAGFADTEARAYQQFAARAGDPLAKLTGILGEEARLARTYDAQLDALEFKSFGDQRARYRASALTAATPTLVSRVRVAEGVDALNEMVARYVLPADLQSPAGASLRAAIGERTEILAPFSAVDGGDYFNAIYSGSFSQVRALDHAYMARLRAIMENSLRGMPFLNGVLNTDSASLLIPVMNIYLTNYGSRYSACLRPDHVEFGITTTTTNGYGATVDRSQSNYKVNREFADAFKAVGTDNPSSAAFADLLMNNGSITKVALGTEQLMARFKCKDPRMQRFEANLLSMFRQL